MQGRREKKWEESVNFIDDHLPYVFNYLLSGSELEFDNKIDNMSLTFKGRSPKVRFNREFFDNLESDQLDFMLAHETMHVAMRHFFMRTVFDNEKLFDMACDIQVNDLLLSAKSGTDGLPVFYKPVVEEMDGFISGPQALGQDTTGLTLTQIYDLLEEQGEDGEGEGGADSHAWMGDGLERAMAARLQAEGEAKGGLEGIGADLGLDFSNDNDKQDAQDFGNSWDLSQGTTIELRGGAKYKLTNKWIDLLARVNPDVLNSFGMGPKPGSHFRTPSRKVAHLYPKILVPNYEAAWNDPARSNKKYCVFLAVDVSGSIPQEWREKFLAFAQSIPKNKIKVEGCLFDTSIYEVEDWNNPPRRGGGGTSFEAVVQWASRKSKKLFGKDFPDALFILTDGEGTFNSGQSLGYKHSDKITFVGDTYHKDSCVSNVFQLYGGNNKYSEKNSFAEFDSLVRKIS